MAEIDTLRDFNIDDDEDEYSRIDLPLAGYYQSR